MPPPGPVWSEIPPKFCLQRKTKLINFLVCICHNLFEEIAIFLVFLFPLLTQSHVCLGLGWVQGGCRPLTMPSLLSSSAVLREVFSCFH